MSTINAPTLGDIQHAGEYGNLSYAHGYFSGDYAQNDKVKMLYLPAGTKIVGASYVKEAFGASVTAKIGYEHVDGSSGNDAAAIAAALDVAAAGNGTIVFVPFTVQKDAVITVVLEGANPANKRFDLILKYDARGQK